MNIKKVYFATRHNTGLKLRAIDSLHFARESKAWTYAKPDRIANSIQTQNGDFFATTPTEYKRATGWNPQFSPENSSDIFRVLENYQSGDNVRFIDYCDKISGAGIDHTGWYCDNFQSELFRGAVFQLPSRDGLPQYLAGYIEPWNDCAILDLDIIRGEKPLYSFGPDNNSGLIEAARIADGLAERFAEQSREADTLFQAEQRIEAATDEIREARENHSAIVAEIRGIEDTQKALNKSPLLCEAIRSRLAGYREAVAELRREIERLKSEPWTIDSGCY